MTAQKHALSEVEIVSQVSIDAHGTAFIRIERAVMRGSEMLHSTCHRTTVARNHDVSSFPSWVQAACHGAWGSIDVASEPVPHE